MAGQPLGKGESAMIQKQIEPKIYQTMNSGPHWIGKELNFPSVIWFVPVHLRSR